MIRYEAMQAIAPLVGDALMVTTNGGATSEWNHVRPTDGNMQVKTLGLCSSIGLGLALALPHRKVFVFDGDGSLWLNLGSLATVGLHQPKNLIHLLWDNKGYESSGGEPTVSTFERIDFAAVARAAGYARAWCVHTVEDLKTAVQEAAENDGPHFIWANVEMARTRVPPRPLDELENKYRFIRYIEQTEGRQILRTPEPHSYHGER